MTLRDGDNWEEYAACAGMPIEAFFPEKGGADEARAVKKMCNSVCPVREQCLRSVIHIGRQDDHGLFGGRSRDERQAIRVEAMKRNGHAA